MKKSALSFLVLALTCQPAAAQQPAEPAALKVEVKGFEPDRPIPEKFAYCTPDGNGKSKDGGNMNPAINWLNAPVNTRSFVVLMVDPDVPASFEDANKEGKTIPADAPRQNFYHWVLTDIPPTITYIAEGQDSSKVIQGGKPTGKTRYGLNGPNDYARAYGAGNGWGGYDGPCPPWNDERLHHYHFQVYALDVGSLGLPSTATGTEVQKAMVGHVLAKGEVVGTYTQNPKLIGK